MPEGGGSPILRIPRQSPQGVLTSWGILFPILPAFGPAREAPLGIRPRSHVHHISRDRARSILEHRLKNCQAPSEPGFARPVPSDCIPLRNGSTLPCPAARRTICDAATPRPVLARGLRFGNRRRTRAGCWRGGTSIIRCQLDRLDRWAPRSGTTGIVRRDLLRGPDLPAPTLWPVASTRATTLGSSRKDRHKCDEFRPVCASSACRAGS
jgi:hypothetical protein